MLCDISSLLDRPATQTPKPSKPIRWQVVHTILSKDHEKIHALYEGNPQLYDSGKMINVMYRPDEIPHLPDSDCLRQNAVLDILDNLPTLSFYDTITLFVIETVQGEIIVNTREDVDEITSYLPIPKDVSHVLTAPINELRKVEMVDMDVDYVTWKGQGFAFKKTGESLQGTIQELTILNNLHDSPHIIDLHAIVIDSGNRIRGFLMPYMYAGNLSDLFQKGRRSEGRADDDESELAFDWSLKLSWARQVTQGVVDLHRIAAYNGDLKPTNILLNQSGEAILIDFLPVGISDAFAAPELLAFFHGDHGTPFQSMLTAAADIYSLGLILYAIAEEKTSKIVQPLEWLNGKIPTWYVDVVQRCLVPEPEDRPSASEVLAVLQQADP